MVDLKTDLEQLFTNFKWNIKGMIDENGNIYPIPPIPQVITGIFQEITKHKVKKLLREKYECRIIQGGPREYPEITAIGGKLGERKIAIDMKTARRIGKNKISGFTIGSFAGYFLYPKRNYPVVNFPTANLMSIGLSALFIIGILMPIVCIWSQMSKLLFSQNGKLRLSLQELEQPLLLVQLKILIS